jgi:hypothetical protein
MTTHTWKAILIAAGPGVIACAILGVAEHGGEHSLVVDALGAYPLTLLLFLPGIPVLAWAVVRAFPPRDWSRDGRRVRPAWLVASWFAPWWHVGAVRFGLWSIGAVSPVNWRIVAQHSVCLWFVTVCGWLCTSSRPQLRLVETFKSTGTVILPAATVKSENAE